MLDLLSSYFEFDYQAAHLAELIIAIIIAPFIQLLVKYSAPLLIKLALSGVVNFKKKDANAEKRIKTLSGVIEATSLLIILLYILLSFLSFMQIDIRPFIAGAGVLSFAVAFGSQSLIKDILSGIFIIVENQFNQGDWIKVDKYEGKVIEINLRRTVLQTIKGARHIIPNGEIAIVTNNTNTYSVVSLDIPTKVTDIDKVYSIIEKLTKKLKKDPEFKDNIIEVPEAKGISDINEFAAIIKIWGKVKTGKHIAIKRELAKRIAFEFNKQKIQMPGSILSASSITAAKKQRSK
ncbi:MAG: mechanosensitive ion channel [Candidatus Moranbacteria bacterium]|nr:mechanosensitive ion channel [Candidatus Moranbacteria bacterium]